MLRVAIVGVMSLLGSCMNSDQPETLIEAVYERDKARVIELASSGAALEERDLEGQTPLVLAASTDQFEIAEVLLDAGADPFAASQFGWTAGYAAQTTNLQRGPEFEAMQRVSQRLRARGYPVPGPDKQEIKQMVAEGNWPPAEWSPPSQ